ncbi:WD domain, G-beta repeat protein [Rhizoctonia solani AG-3 Rhs1AP]|uniref:WD domain, G-beta repeat protein n=1 Tax=Rhizoctonia solani AG-3 Rhs1AP TaxID=1086054 RepID=X8JIS9_9AGAM|nr:WD domain, G-beta repeat protein [Rhizoctonia solani AG-3 Rhs1AP]
MSEQDQDHSRQTTNDDAHDGQDIDFNAETEGTGLQDDFGILSAFLAASSHGDNPNAAITSNDGRVSISIGQLLSYLARRSGGSGEQIVSLGEDDEDADYVPDEDDDYEPEDYDEEDDNEEYTGWGHRHFNEVGHFFPTVTEPETAGLKLLYSGEFGPPPSGPVTNIEQEIQKTQSRRATKRAQRSLEPTPKVETNQYPAHYTTYRLPMSPIRGPFAPRNYRVEAGRGLVPNSSGAIVALYDDKVYSGQFSLDANIYYSCTQGHDIWVYDANSTGDKTTHPQTGHQSRMNVLNRVKGIYGNWTVTDSHLSPDNERLIYSSISPVVHLTKLHEPNAQHISLDFSSPGPYGRNRRVFGIYEDSFGIWTCRFSADGKEVVACGSHQIFVWDLAAHKRIVNISAHKHDVNSCCWADTASGNVLISGSDDTMIKVWDRRSLSSNRPSGVLPGHTEGVTSVSAKGDGRYIISNGKDHALRLWDLRMMREDEEVVYGRYGQSDYDYRYGSYKKPKRLAHPQDCSVMTYRGHSVFRTLIRCHFSPAETTGQAYIYSGSTDGKVYIWSLDGRIVQTLDRTQTLPITFDPREPDLPLRPTAHRSRHNDMTIRDCSWHPREPALLSCYWHRDESSSIGRHEWKSLGKRGLTLEDVVEKEQQEATEQWARTNIFATN